MLRFPRICPLLIAVCFAAAAYAQDFETIKRAAENGDAQAQFSLGAMYALGRDVAQSNEEAVKWFRLAAEQDNADAQNILGNMHLQGRGVARSDAEAGRWFRSAAELGNANAQNSLGNMYLTGRGVAQSDALAVKWYRMAAEQGNAHAQNNLGNMYLKGLGVMQSETEAMKWFQMAAEQGNTDAQYNLGDTHIKEQSGATVVLTAGRAGHFFTQGRINGRAVSFMVDTGASFISLGPSDAKRLGLDLSRGAPVQMRTANGIISSLKIQLDTVTIGDITLHNVEAVVGQHDRSHALLGMSFLSRTDMQYKGDTLLLKQRF